MDASLPKVSTQEGEGMPKHFATTALWCQVASCVRIRVGRPLAFPEVDCEGDCDKEGRWWEYRGLPDVLAKLVRLGKRPRIEENLSGLEWGTVEILRSTGVFCKQRSDRWVVLSTKCETRRWRESLNSCKMSTPKMGLGTSATTYF